MFFTKSKLNVETTSLKANEPAKEMPGKAHGYQAPELHDVGKAVELVQGGGGGNYLDANRSRYY
jgi:hypothetical protein